MMALLLGLGNASATTITFTELSTRNANGMSLSGVTFNFKIGGTDSSEAIFNYTGPGPTTYTADPGLEGNTAGTLRLDFGTAVGSLQFGVALSTTATLANGFTVSLYDPSALFISMSTIGVSPGSFTFTSGQFNYAGGPVARADVTFNNTAASRFMFDNLSFEPTSVPDSGSTFVLLGAGILACQAGRRMACRRSTHRSGFQD